MAAESEAHVLTKVCCQQTMPLCQQLVSDENIQVSFQLFNHLPSQICQSSELWESHQFIHRFSEGATAFKCVEDPAANDTTAVDHGKSATYGFIACVSPFNRMQRTSDEPTIHLKCGFTKQKRCRQRRNISAKFASIRRSTEELP